MTGCWSCAKEWVVNRPRSCLLLQGSGSRAPKPWLDPWSQSSHDTPNVTDVGQNLPTQEHHGVERLVEQSEEIPSRISGRLKCGPKGFRKSTHPCYSYYTRHNVLV